MLREMKGVKQLPGEPPRRWFTDDDFDVIVFVDPSGGPIGFHLCYDKGENERVLIWDDHGGYAHGGIDDGETLLGGMKSSPIIVNDGAFDKTSVIYGLRMASGNIDQRIASFLIDKIEAFESHLGLS